MTNTQVVAERETSSTYGELRNGNKILVEKPEGKRSLICEDNIKMYPKAKCVRGFLLSDLAPRCLLEWNNRDRFMFLQGSIK